MQQLEKVLVTIIGTRVIVAERHGAVERGSCLHVVVRRRSSKPEPSRSWRPTAFTDARRGNGRRATARYVVEGDLNGSQCASCFVDRLDADIVARRRRARTANCPA